MLQPEKFTSEKSIVNNSNCKRRKRHRQKGEFICTYDDCDKIYSTLSHLIRHEEIHSEKTFECTEKNCGRHFKTKATLKKHIDNIHLKKNPKIYKCPDCNKEFNKRNWLTRHRVKHTGIEPYVCPYDGCGKRYLLPSRLKRHMKIHEGYKCTKENCGMTFQKWSLYAMHLKISHSLMHKCDHCGKNFSRTNNLKDHMEIHKLDREVFFCPKPSCKRFYFDRRNLNAHINSYHDKYTFLCPQENCHRAFKSEADVIDHCSRYNHKKLKMKRKRKGKPKPKPDFATHLAGLAPKKWQLQTNIEQTEIKEIKSEACSRNPEESEVELEVANGEISQNIFSNQTIEGVSNLSSDENSNVLSEQTVEDRSCFVSDENSIDKNNDMDYGIKMLLNMIDDRNKLTVESSVRKGKCISLKA